MTIKNGERAIPVRSPSLYYKLYLTKTYNHIRQFSRTDGYYHPYCYVIVLLLYMTEKSVYYSNHNSSRCIKSG